MGIREGSRTILINTPDAVLTGAHLPPLNISQRLTGLFDYIHFFTTTQQALDKRFASLKKHLRVTGMLWVSWPRARQLDTDLNLKHVIRIGYRYGLVESKTIRLNDTWSAIKFTHPKKGKLYNNHYGELKR